MIPGLGASFDAAGDIVGDAGVSLSHWRLFEICDPGAGSERALALVGLKQTAREFEKRRFPRTIAADESEPVVLTDQKVKAFKERSTAKAKRQIGKCEKRSSH